MDRPVIGMCTALERARWSVWDQPAVLLSRSYVDAVHRAGAMAVLLPPDPKLLQRPEDALELIETQDAVPERDAFEIALTRAAIERDVPVLGICRGMQLINVALGGTLIQDLPEHFGHSEHRRVSGSFDGSDHDVDVLDETLAMRVIGASRHATKSHHHQGVERIGEGLRVSATSPFDGLVEAIELPERSFVLGVQWHPEADPSSPVVGGLVEAAATHARARGVAS